MTNQVVLLTGGSSGIGAATAHLLCRSGMTVYAASRSGAMPPDVYPCSKHRNNEGRIVPISLDVTQEETLQQAVASILEAHGHLDAVICNAGNGMAGAIEDTDSQEVAYQFNTCFFGAVNTIQACLPVFRQQGYGRIVTISSVAAVIPIPYQAFYSSVKAALLMFTKALRLEVERFGIQCACILPGDTKTGFTQARKYSRNSQLETSAYRQKMQASLSKMEHDEQNGMSPVIIAKAVCKQLKKRRMDVTHTPRFDYRCIDLLSRLLPNKWLLRIVSWLYN